MVFEPHRVHSWLMVAALLPSLVFLGHWGATVRIPGTEIHVRLLRGDPDERGHDEHSDGHARHCHGDAASCSDVPFAGANGLALLREFSEGLAGRDVAVARPWATPELTELSAPTPERRPPRFA